MGGKKNGNQKRWSEKKAQQASAYFNVIYVCVEIAASNGVNNFKCINK